MNEDFTFFNRPWGSYIVLNKSEKYLIKLLKVNPMQQLSLQKHNFRAEHWVVCKGIATVIKSNTRYILKEGESIDIKINELHSLQNHTNEELCILELQYGETLSEDDITRIEDIYGRV